jgi:hypothetical protein
MNSNKVTLAAIAAIGVALGFAVVPALTTSQAFAQDCPGCQGGGHEREETCDKKNTDVIEEGPCPGESQKSKNKDEGTTINAGQSGNPKFICNEEGVCTRV